MSLKELNPDFVISVSYQTDDIDGNASQSSIKNLTKLIDTLASNGFYSQIRPGEKKTFLVFIKISNESLFKGLEALRSKDWLYGVSQEYLETSDLDPTVDVEKLTPAERLRIVYHLLTMTTADNGCGICIGSPEWDFVRDIIPIYDMEQNRRIVKQYAKKGTIDGDDIQFIRENYGEKIALYFSYLKFYLRRCVILGLVGVASNYYLGRYSIIFTVVNLFWGLDFTKSWKRQELNLSVTWGTQDCSLVETKRPEFKGESEVYDYASERNIPHYPTWKRYVKQLAFVPVAVSAALTLVGFQFLCFSIEIFLTEIYNGPFKQFLSLVPTVLIVGFVPILTAVYSKIVDKMLNWENHEYQATHEDSRLIKTFVLNFLTSYVPLIITSFVYLPFAHLVAPYLGHIQDHIHRFVGQIGIKSSSDFTINQERLNGQYLYFMLTNQVIQLITEYGLPSGISFAKSKLIAAEKFDDNEEEAEYLSSVRFQLTQPQYNVHDEYRQMVLQFGYLMLFGPVWSVAPIICAVFNAIQLKGDATKLLLSFRRPIPERADCIEPWKSNLELLMWVGSITSASVTAMFRGGHEINGDGFASINLKTWSLFAVILASEHIFFVANLVLDTIYQKFDIPAAQEKAKSLLSARKSIVSGILKKRQSQVSNLTANVEEAKWSKFSSKEVIQSATKLPAKVNALNKPEKAVEPEKNISATESKLARSGSPASGFIPMPMVDISSNSKSFSSSVETNEKSAPVYNKIADKLQKAANEMPVPAAVNGSDKLEEVSTQGDSKVSSEKALPAPNTVADKVKGVVQEVKQGSLPSLVTSVGTSAQGSAQEFYNSGSDIAVDTLKKAKQAASNKINDLSGFSDSEKQQANGLLDKGDSLIASIENGAPKLATMDGNNHFTPPAESGEEKAVEVLSNDSGDSRVGSNRLDELKKVASDATSRSGSDSPSKSLKSSAKSVSKKTSIKNIFKKSKS